MIPAFVISVNPERKAKLFSAVSDPQPDADIAGGKGGEEDRMRTVRTLAHADENKVWAKVHQIGFLVAPQKVFAAFFAGRRRADFYSLSLYPSWVACCADVLPTISVVM